MYALVLIENSSSCSEFQLIHELCLYVLSASQRAELIRATLATLHAFLSWIPLGYIFESTLVCTIFFFAFLSLFHLYVNHHFWPVNVLWLKACVLNRMNLHIYIITYFFYLVFFSQLETLLKFFPSPVYRNLTLQCLTEVFFKLHNYLKHASPSALCTTEYVQFVDYQYVTIDTGRSSQFWRFL